MNPLAMLTFNETYLSSQASWIAPFLLLLPVLA
jgi:hypothetical protein